MLLTEINILHYLLDRGLIDKTAFVNGKFSCHKGNSRHKNFIVNKELETNSYFIKQALGSTAEKMHSLEREGLFYELSKTYEDFGPLQKYLTALLHYDQRNAILVLQYLSDHSNIYDKMLYQQQFNTTEVATELADALFKLHSIEGETIEKLKGAGFIESIKPWILSLHDVKSLSAINARSEAEAASLQLIGDGSAFMSLIESASKLWEPTCLVHGDSKLNNFIIKNDIQTGSSSLKLIDWELFNTGDPLWDMATVFQSALTAWVINEDPVYKANKGVKTFDHAKMQNFISVCFTKYAEANKWDNRETRVKLEKCTAFCSLRLLHNCFETTPHAQSLRPYSVRLLQLAYNILSNTSGAARQVLGINL